MQQRAGRDRSQRQERKELAQENQSQHGSNRNPRRQGNLRKQKNLRKQEIPKKQENPKK